MRAAYLELADAEPDRFVVVDASRPVDQIAAEIAAEIRRRLAGRV